MQSLRPTRLGVRSSTHVTDELMARAGMGVDNIDVAAATRRGIAVLGAALDVFAVEPLPAN
jgi:phosphoglycerate dehydrogenase-like enzyme